MADVVARAALPRRDREVVDITVPPHLTSEFDRITKDQAVAARIKRFAV